MQTRDIISDRIPHWRSASPSPIPCSSCRRNYYIITRSPGGDRGRKFGHASNKDLLQNTDFRQRTSLSNSPSPQYCAYPSVERHICTSSSAAAVQWKAQLLYEGIGAFKSHMARSRGKGSPHDTNPGSKMGCDSSAAYAI